MIERPLSCKTPRPDERRLDPHDAVLERLAAFYVARPAKTCAASRKGDESHPRAWVFLFFPERSSSSRTRVCERHETNAGECVVLFRTWPGSPWLWSRRRACVQLTGIDLHFVLCNSVVSSPIWTLDSSNDSRGPSLSSTHARSPSPDTCSPTLKIQRNSRSIP